MSERIRLATGSVGELQALGAFGRPVHSLYAQLRAVVGARLSARHAALFAEPVMHSSDNRIDWYAPVDGQARRLADLPPQEAQAAQATLQQLLAELSALSAQMAASTNDSDQALGHLISLALSTPDDSHLFVVGDQPVLSFWGFARRGGTAQAAPLHGFGGQAAQPAAAAAPVAAIAVARGSPLPWLMWGIAFLLLVLAALLLMRAVGGMDIPGLAWLDGPAAQAAGPTGPGGPATPAATQVAERAPADDSALVAARDRERALRAQLAALQSDMERALASCPVPQRPPAATLVPDRPANPVRPLDRAEVDRPGVDLDRVVPLPDRDATDLAALDRPDDPDLGTDTAETDEPAPDEPAVADEPPAGAPLTIDRAARDAQDLAALEGRWRTGRSLMDQGSTDPLEIEYAFDAEGRGRSTIRLDDGVTCSAEAQAAYNGPDAVVITELDHPACSDGTEFERSEVVCVIDADGSTICEGAQAGGSGYPVGLYAAE
ncbi:MAG: SrfA family protein [Alphaproteobacteria bacterium]